MTKEEFVIKHKIHMTCKRTSRNPSMTDDKWDADHWRCTLSRGGA